MSRLAIALLFVVAVAFVTADDGDACEEEGDCACGSVCNDGICSKGCRVYDTFMAPGDENKVYGRTCRCGDIESEDDRGLMLECEDDVEFEDAPIDFEEWENNPACAVPHPEEAIAAADIPATEATAPATEAAAPA